MIQENDFSIIKPVENMQNVGALAPIDKHTQKRQKQARRERNRTTAEQQDGTDAQQEAGGPGNDADRQGSIDYRA